MFRFLLLQVIAELLRFLKRSYWPFAWDSSSAGGSSTGVRTLPLTQPLMLQSPLRTLCAPHGHVCIVGMRNG